MLRIQFDGLVIELGRDRGPARETAGILAAAMPYVISWLQRSGFASYSREDEPPAKEEAN